MGTKAEKIIKRMAQKGYDYDGIESGPGQIRFQYVGGTFPLTFPTWEAVEEWLRDMV